MNVDNALTVEVAEIVFARAVQPVNVEHVYQVTRELMPTDVSMAEFARVLAWMNLNGLVQMAPHDNGITTIQRTKAGIEMATMFSHMQNEAIAHKQRMIAVMRGEAWS